MLNPLVESYDVVLIIADFVDDHQYLFFAAVSTAWMNAWGQRAKLTRAVMANTMVSQLLESFESGLKERGELCEEAASLGRLDLLRCARVFGCSWPDSLNSKAAEGGHVDVMIWARAHYCPLEKDTCHVAARAGHLNALQWARSNGCPWDETTCAEAALRGHLSNGG